MKRNKSRVDGGSWLLEKNAKIGDIVEDCVDVIIGGGLQQDSIIGNQYLLHGALNKYGCSTAINDLNQGDQMKA